MRSRSGRGSALRRDPLGGAATAANGIIMICGVRRLQPCEPLPSDGQEREVR